MPYIETYKEEENYKRLIKEIDFFKSDEIDDVKIRQIVGKQKGQLNVDSNYYSGNIAEANWSVIEEDSDIKWFDTEIIEKSLVKSCVEAGKSIRENNSEYTYVFIPSYYAVKSLILYYIRYTRNADRIYGLKNAVVRYMRFIYAKKTSIDDSLKYDFAEVMQELLDRKIGLDKNNAKDDFINDIIDCINNSACISYIRDKRIKDFKDDKEKYYCIEYNGRSILDKGKINFSLVGDYKILMHRDVEKDWIHIQKYIDKANEIIANTPNFPNNIPPKNDPLEADIKGWFSQRVSHKDRVVYKKDSKEKIVYIATVCDHYKNAARRTKSNAAYK